MAKRHREHTRCGGCGGGGAGTGDSDIVGEQFPFDMFNWFSLAWKIVEVLMAAAAAAALAAAVAAG